MLFLDFMTKWEPIWLALAFIVSIGFEAFTAYWIVKEYQYDEAKDLEKKQRKTRTTKKTTSKPGGETVVEESQEVTEPINQGEQK